MYLPRIIKNLFSLNWGKKINRMEMNRIEVEIES